MSIPTLKDSRCGLHPVPRNFADYLTLRQQVALFGLGRLGWRLKFIRRPYHEAPIVVLRSRLDENQISVLEQDGHINTSPMLQWRQ